MFLFIHSFSERKSNLDATSNSLRWPSCKGLNEPGRITFLLKFVSTGATLKKKSIQRWKSCRNNRTNNDQGHYDSRMKMEEILE